MVEPTHLKKIGHLPQGSGVFNKKNVGAATQTPPNKNLGNDHMGPTKREVGVSSSAQKYVAGRFGVDDFPFQVGDFLDSM